MDNLKNVLNKYVFDCENPEINYELGIEYYSLGQTAAAISYLLRAAERTEDKNLAYECLLLIAICFELQSNRDNTVRCVYKQAICLIPDRPEAYYLLSRFNQSKGANLECYMNTVIGLNFSNENHPKLRNESLYPGKYGLLFQKAVSSWWWGKSSESRKLFHLLADEHANEMDESHYNAVQSNMTSLGCGPESQGFRYYDQSNFAKLRYKFPGSENIKKTYSQVYQDMFVLSMLNGKRKGRYLEIGSAKPFFGNNTALLETEFDWVGIGIEYKQEFVDEYLANRKNPVLFADATKVDYNNLLMLLSPDGLVDYLQLDCEPSKTTYEILKMIPFDKYKFAVITYEHDHYVDITRTYRTKSREYLESKGYELVVSDVSPDGMSTFEDWWVHPDLVSREIIDKMKDLHGIKQIEEYFLNNK